MTPRPPLKFSAICFLVSFCSNWPFGYQVTYVNTAVKTFYKLMNNDYASDHGGKKIPDELWNTQWSLTVASFYPGALLGFCLVPICCKKLGLKWSYVISTVPGIVGSIVSFFAHKAAQDSSRDSDLILCEFFIIGRILIGIHGGAALALLPLWVTECCSPQHQGFFLSFQQVAQALASLLGFIFGVPDLFESKYQIELLQLIGLFPTLLLLLAMLLLPKPPPEFDGPLYSEGAIDSVRFYLNKRKSHEVEEVLASQSEQRALTELLATERSQLAQIFLPKTQEDLIIRRGVLIGSLAGLSYAFTGDDLIDSFSSQIFQNLGIAGTQEDQGFSDLISALVTIAIGLVLLITSGFGAVLVESAGRRLTLIGGLLGTAIANAVAVLCLRAIDLDNLVLGILTMMAFCVVKAFIGLGAGGPAWFLTSELVPRSHRQLAQTLSTGILLSMSGIVTAVYLPLQNLIQEYSILVLASVPALICAIALYRYLPETRGKSTHQIMVELSENERSLILSSAEDSHDSHSSHYSTFR